MRSARLLIGAAVPIPGSTNCARRHPSELLFASLPLSLRFSAVIKVREWSETKLVLSSILSLSFWDGHAHFNAGPTDGPSSNPFHVCAWPKRNE